MRVLLLLAMACPLMLLGNGGNAESGTAGQSQAAAQETISGAGSTFIYPAMSSWIFSYEASAGDLLDYSPVGSKEGLEMLEAGAITFSVSERALTKDELGKQGMVQFPIVFGAVVLAFNLPEVASDKLVLSGEVLADIYQGKITTWNDEALAKLNPDLKLPERKITPVFRSDASGSTFAFTKYLSSASAEFKEALGADWTVKWPAGIGGRGNTEAAAYVSTIPYSIGYVNFSYADQHRLPVAQLIGADGKAIPANMDTFKTAVNAMDWSDSQDFSAETIPSVSKGWPIMAASFAGMMAKPKDISAPRATLQFFEWVFDNGGSDAEQQSFVPLPGSLQRAVKAYWAKGITSEGKPLYP